MRPFRGQGDEELPVIFTYALNEGREYQLTHRVGAGTTVELTEPFTVTLAPAALAAI